MGWPCGCGYPHQYPHISRYIRHMRIGIYIRMAIPIKHTCDVKHEKDCQKYFNIFLIHWQSQFHLTDLWHLHCISLNRKLEPVKKSFKGISSYWRITRAIFTKKFLSSPLFAMWPNICAKLFGMIPFSSGTDLQQMLSKFYENVMNKNILL